MCRTNASTVARRKRTPQLPGQRGLWGTIGARLEKDCERREISWSVGYKLIKDASVLANIDGPDFAVQAQGWTASSSNVAAVRALRCSGGARAAPTGRGRLTSQRRE